MNLADLSVSLSVCAHVSSWQGQSKNETECVSPEDKFDVYYMACKNVLRTEIIAKYIIGKLIVVSPRLVETAEGRLPRMQNDYTKVLAETKEYYSRYKWCSKIFQQNVPREGRRRVTSSPITKVKRIQPPNTDGKRASNQLIKPYLQ